MGMLMVSFSLREDCNRRAHHIFSSSALRIVLSSLFCEGENKGVFRCTKLNHSVPTISHLISADDFMIFGEATATNLETMKQILDIYSSRSGLVINYSKFSIFFTYNLLNSVKNELAGILEVQFMQQDER